MFELATPSHPQEVRKDTQAVRKTSASRGGEISRIISTAGTKSTCRFVLIRMASLKRGKHDTLYPDGSEREGATHRECTKNGEATADNFLAKVAEENVIVCQPA